MRFQFALGVLYTLPLLTFLFQRVQSVPTAGNLSSVYIRSAAQGCENGLRGALLLELCFNATYDLVRRGVSQDIAGTHVGSVLNELVKYAKDTEKDPTVDTVADLCVPVEKYSPLFTVRWTTVYTEEELDDMLMTIGNSFYSVANIDVPLPFNATLDAERLVFWLNFKLQLDGPMGQIDYSKIAFPQTALHSHDWRQGNACSEWDRFSAHPVSRTAENGLRKVLKMAVELITKGADPASTWQLVRHYTSFVHLGIRCLKAEGMQLMVPDFFMASYGKAAIKLLRKAQQDGKLVSSASVPDDAFDAVFQFEYKRLAQFASWGQPDAHFGPGITIKNMLSYTSTASISQLSIATQFFSITNGTDVPTSARPVSQPDCITPSANNHENMMCETTDSFCFYPATWQVLSWYENCCNELICNNVVAVLPDYFDDYSDCCKACHQLDCSPAIAQDETINVPKSTGNENVTVHVYV